MSVESIAIVLHHSRAKGTAKLVMLGIANHDGDGGAWPTVATLAKYANVTERNVIKAVQSLRGMGELEVDLQAGGTPNIADSRRPNRYHVRVVCPPWCDRTSAHRDTRSHQPPLLKTPLSLSTPPVAIDTPPLSDATPPPLSNATPKPSIEPSLNPVVALSSSVTRARGLCSVCGLSPYECQRRWPANEHTYAESRRTG